jgi:hypothetical protein
MSKLESMNRHDPFKLKRSKRLKELIAQVHGLGVWIRFKEEWELNRQHSSASWEWYNLLCLFYTNIQI